MGMHVVYMGILICMPSALGHVALGPWAYISGKSPMATLQLLHMACGPRALGIHIRQIPHGHVTTITYTYV